MSNMDSQDRRCSPKLTLIVGLIVYSLSGSGAAAEPQAGQAEPSAKSVLNADDDARTVVDKAIKAMGGQKAFSCWSCGRIKFKTAGGILPAAFGDATVVDTFQLPGRYKRVVFARTPGNEPLLMTWVVVHGKGWQKAGENPARPIENQCSETSAHPFAGMWNLEYLAGPGVKLTQLGVKKIRGIETIGIRAQAERAGACEFYFEVQTGLLHSSVKTIVKPGTTQTATGECTFCDYKNMQGVQVPMQICVTADGETQMDVTFTEVMFSDGFDDGVFAKP